MNIVKLNRWLVLALISLSPFAAANFEQAYSLYEQKKFQEAYLAFEALASVGDTAAQFNLGVMFYKGEAVEKDPTMAYAWLIVAAKDSKDDNAKSTAEKIYARLAEDEKKLAEQHTEQLLKLYDSQVIIQSIFPKPLRDEDCEPEFLPLVKKAPLYPRTENRRGKMGIAELEFTISPEGYVRDVVVNKSASPGFSRESIKATPAFRYQKPKNKNNEQPSYGMRNIFTFHLEDYGGGTRIAGTKKIKEDLISLEEQAKSGDPRAQFIYASKLNTYKYYEEYLPEIDLEYQTANNWYQKAAERGVIQAQYIMGKNMIEGQGCEVDIENGFKWVNVAAIGGLAKAQNLLARKLLDNNDQIAAVRWLKNGHHSKNDLSTVLLAWELATSTIESIQDAQYALEIIDQDFDNYFDKVRINETKAAALASLGDFKKAIIYQKKALKQAKKYKWEIPLISQRLEHYQNNKPWQGGYY